MAATLSQSFGNPLMMALHLTESAGGAWECSWVPQPPHLHHWDALLLWVPRIRAWSQSLKQPLFLFDLIPPFIPMKVISLSLPLLLLSLYSVSLLLPVAPVLPAEPLQSGRREELPNSFSCESSHKVITDFLCFIIIIPICPSIPL